VLPRKLLLLPKPVALRQKEYAPTLSDIPPPYTFAPEEEPPPITDDVALQPINVLLDMVCTV
jgi:hypothetical protein